MRPTRSAVGGALLPRTCRRSLLRLGILALLASTLLPAPVRPAWADTRTVKQDYVAGLDAVLVDCTRGIGGVCFDLSGDEETVVVRVDDRSGQPVGGTYRFTGAGDELLGESSFCGTFTSHVPAGSALLRVFLAAATGPLACAEHAGTGIATTGTAEATFELSGPDNTQYTLPRWFEWDTDVLDVLIVPPEHGQIANDNGVLAGLDPDELDPLRNSYLRAIEDSISAWRTGIARFGASWLDVRINSYVVGRDPIPQAALTDPEVVVTTDQTKGPTLGFALQHDTSTPCLVNSSKFFVTSMTYADLYNINGQEIGHCFGLFHTSDGYPDHDLMDGTYDDTPGQAGTHLHCVSNLDVLGLEQVFGGFFERPTTDLVSMAPDQYETIPCSAGNPTGAT